MLRYIVKRVLLFIPTVFVITLLVFFINSLTPGDSVEMMLESGKGEGQRSENSYNDKSYKDLRSKLGLDLPLFYVSIQALSVPDTLRKIDNKQKRDFLKMLCMNSGNSQSSTLFFRKVELLQSNVLQWKSYDLEEIEALGYVLEKVFFSANPDELSINMQDLDKFLVVSPSGKSEAQINSLIAEYANWKINTSLWKNYVFKISFNLDNQYHRWLFGNGSFSKGILRGDFGISYQDKRSVNSILPLRLSRTLLISLISIFLSYLIALPLGIYSSRIKGSKTDKVIEIVLFALYSLPTFWVATLLIMFFGGGDYYDVFPTYGLGEIPENASRLEVFQIRFYHLILPVFCWTYTGLAFLSRQMRGAMLDNLGMDYIRTARAKGLSEKAVAWRHNFKNALLPLITLIADVFPSMIAGSVVLEVIFSIPGMGKLAFDSIISKDFPVLTAIVLISSLLTIFGYFVADILYFIADPRIKTKTTQS